MQNFYKNIIHDGDILVFGIAAWRWIAFLVTIFLALLASKLFQWMAARKILTVRFPIGGDFARKFTEFLNPVIRWALLLVVTHQGIIFLQLNPEVRRILNELFKVAYAILISIFLSRLIQLLLEVWGARTTDSSSIQLRSSLIPALNKLAKVTIFIMAFLVLLENAGFHVGSMLAGLGIGGLAVALAAQETLANLFGSMAIFLDKPFLLGERIQIDKFDGTVEKIGLRSTLLRQLNGTLASIPNRTISQTPINNISRAPRLQNCPTISLVRQTSAEKIEEALKILREIYKSHPDLTDPDVTWKDFAQYSLDISICYWSKDSDYGKFSAAIEKTNLEIKKQFEAAGIELAYPTRTLYLNEKIDKSAIKADQP